MPGGSPSPLPAPFTGGRYQLRRLLGEGSRKRVYLAYDGRLDREVALALIKTDGLDDAGLARLRREAQAMGRLGDHPHIVTLHDIGEENGQPYLVSQYLPGESVDTRLRQGAIAVGEAVRIAEQICRGLGHAHAHGVRSIAI